jgi:hypothetical protein
MMRGAWDESGFLAEFFKKKALTAFLGGHDASREALKRWS